MRKLKIFALAASALVLCGCPQPTPDPQPQPQPQPQEDAYVTLDSGQNTSVAVGYEGTEFSIGFKTNKNWSIDVTFGSGSSGWVLLSSNSGSSGSQALIATVQANETDAKRTAIIAIKAGDASANITINQDPFVSEFSISPSSVDVDAAGGTVEVKVTSNIGYHASTSVEWIHTLDTKASQTKSLWFTVDANESAFERSGVIVICNDNDVCIPVTVNQAAGKATISISVSSLEFSYEGGEQKLTVTSNSDWTAESSAQWCYVNPSSENGECTVIVRVDENTLKEARSANVVFQTGESKKTLLVTQKAFETVFELSTRSETVSADGGTVSVTVTSNIGYHCSVSNDWIHEVESKADQGKIHTFSIDGNKSVEQRSGAIVFCNDENVCIPVNILQEAAPSVINVSTGQLNFTSLNGEQTVSITSNTTWTVSENPEWCTVTPNGGEGDATATITVTENGNTYPREGTITFTAKGDVSVKVTVKQQAGEPKLEISETELSLLGSGDNVVFSITSNADWVVNTGASWLKASAESGNGNALITLTAEQNPKVETRTAEVVVKTVDGVIRKKIAVAQAEGEPNLELSTYILEFDHQGTCTAVNVTSNVGWTAVSSAAWCTVEKSTQTNVITVCVKSNDSGKKRTAEITVKTDKGGLEKIISVLQTTPEDNEGFGDDGEINWD